MSAEECAERFRVIQRMGNDPYVRHMGHLTNHFMSWNRTNECVLLWLCISLCVYICECVRACTYKKNVLASKKRRKEKISEGKEKLVSKDIPGDCFHVCLVRFVLKIWAADWEKCNSLGSNFVKEELLLKCRTSPSPHTYTTNLRLTASRIMSALIYSLPSTHTSSVWGFNLQDTGIQSLYE